MKNTHTIIFWFAGVAFLVAVVVAASFRTFNRIDGAANARKHSYSIIIRTDALLSELIDAETGQRGFLLTGDDRLLEPYLLVRDSISRHLEELSQQMQIVAARKQLGRLTKLINAKLAYLSHSIVSYRNHDMASALANARGNQDKKLMDSIRTEMHGLIQLQERALAQHDTALQSSMRNLLFTIIASGLLMLLLVLFLVYLINRETRQRVRNSVHLETQHLLKVQEETNKQLELTNSALQASEGKTMVTLNSIGDGVITTDAEGRVTLLNPVAEKLTGWTQAEARGRTVDDVFCIINETTRQPAVIPVKETLAQGTTQGLANHTILIARNGSECAIDDSCAPIRTPDGKVIGAVLVFRDITRRREIEIGLETTRKELEIIKKTADDANEFAESVINTVREPLISLDQDLRVVTVSRSFYDFFKVKPEDTVGQLIYNLGNKQWDIPKLRELLETILPQKASFDNYEVEHDFTTIGRKVMLLNARQIQRVWGKDRIILLAIEDITERKEIENGLEKTRKELEVIKKIADGASEFSACFINTVREPLISLDQDLRVVTVSRSFYDFFKVKPEETIGQLIYDLGNKQWNIPKLRELLETILPQKASFDNYEVEHNFATIGRRVMLLNARQIEQVMGKERIILLAIEDITERKEIENELQKTRMELERIVRVQKMVISDTKESLDIETEGRRFEKSEHSHRQEALEAVYAMETTFDFSIESLYDQIVSSIATTLRTPSVGIYEYRDGKIARCSGYLDHQILRNIPHSTPCTACQAVLDDKNSQQFSGDLGKRFIGKLCFDTLRFHSYAGVPINGSQGEVLGMINVLEDKTRTFTDSEIKFIETFARYIAHELSRRDLEFRLRRGEEMRLLGQLTSGVAHEVRNPLNGILSIMGVLTKELSDDNRFLPYLQHMRNQVTRLTVLMQDLLVLGRPIREEDIHELSMVTLVESALQTWLQTLGPTKPPVRFIKPEPPEMCVIKADDTYMTQIIVNLLENARNHSPSDAEIVCTVRRHFFNTAAFCVTDRGSGIPEINLPKIFDPFFTTRKGGTGLGLSIVKNIVESHKGSVSAYNNTDGPGATFEVIVPLS